MLETGVPLGFREAMIGPVQKHIIHPAELLHHAVRRFMLVPAGDDRDVGTGISASHHTRCMSFGTEEVQGGE